MFPSLTFNVSFWLFQYLLFREFPLETEREREKQTTSISRRNVELSVTNRAIVTVNGFSTRLGRGLIYISDALSFANIKRDLLAYGIRQRIRLLTVAVLQRFEVTRGIRAFLVTCMKIINSLSVGLIVAKGVRYFEEVNYLTFCKELILLSECVNVSRNYIVRYKCLEQTQGKHCCI